MLQGGLRKPRALFFRPHPDTKSPVSKGLKIRANINCISMMKKNILVTGAATLVAIGSMAMFAFAQTPPPDPGKQVKFHVEIKDNGRVLVRGAKVTSIATSTINAALTWEGGASIPWVITTDGSTEYVRYHGGKGLFSEFAVGHTISFSGWLVPASSLTVRADTVRNWSVSKEKVNPFGFIQSIDAPSKSFMLKTEERGDIKVLVMDDTKILKGKATTTFAVLKVGDKLHARGLWDSTVKTLRADLIKIFVENRRTFEGGKLKSASATSTLPTSIVVTFQKFDYTIGIDVGTAVINKRWEPVNLSDFRIGDHLRIYGVPEGLNIEATVVRNMNLPR